MEDVKLVKLENGQVCCTVGVQISTESIIMVNQQESKFVQLTTKSKTKETVTGDYEVPPESDDDELVAFSNNPFSNSSNTYSSPFDKKQDHANVPTLAWMIKSMTMPM